MFTFNVEFPESASVQEVLVSGWLCNQQTVEAAGRQGVQLRRDAWFDLPPRLLSRLHDGSR